MNSKLFIITLIAALTSFVAASGSADQSLAVKRAALQQRMHQRAVAGHGALKKRVQVDAGKARIQRAQYKPTRTAAAAPGMEKRQLGVGIGNLPVPGTGGSVPVPCISVGPLGNLPIGCTVMNNNPKPSQAACSAGGYDGCNPGSAIGTGAGFGSTTGSGGISACCQSGFTCTQVGPFGGSICLNFIQAYDVNAALVGQTFKTQQQLADFLGALKAAGK